MAVSQTPVSAYYMLHMPKSAKKGCCVSWNTKVPKIPNNVVLSMSLTVFLSSSGSCKANHPGANKRDARMVQSMEGFRLH